MKKVDCYLCGAKEHLILFQQKGRDPYFEIIFGHEEKNDLFWQICKKCGFVYRSPSLSKEELAILYNHYENDVLKDTDPDEYFNKIVTLPENESENFQKIKWLRIGLQRKHEDFFSSASVLDVGCGGGTLLYTLKERLKPKKLYGVELNSVYAKLANRRTDANIKQTDYRAGLFKKKFELVICTKVLEHIIDPLKFLSQIEQDMDDNGFLFLEVPDIQDMWNLPPDHDRFYIPHLYYFSVRTITVLLEKVHLIPTESRATVTKSGRAYLQVIAEKKWGNSSIAGIPYDNPNDVFNKIKKNE